jgi:hypothetical protein
MLDADVDVGAVCSAVQGANHERGTRTKIVLGPLSLLSATTKTLNISSNSLRVLVELSTLKSREIRDKSYRTSTGFFLATSKLFASPESSLALAQAPRYATCHVPCTSTKHNAFEFRTPYDMGNGKYEP